MTRSETTKRKPSMNRGLCSLAFVALLAALSLVTTGKSREQIHRLKEKLSIIDKQIFLAKVQKSDSRVLDLEQGSDPLSPFYNPTDPDSIRSWGCHLQTTPTIFVHIGKAGGGSVRARFAAAGLNFTRLPEGWRKVEDNSYFDVDERVNGLSKPKEDTWQDNRRAYFCNSGHSSRRPTAEHKAYEGYELCKATTPLGRSVACPSLISENKKRCKVAGCNTIDPYCHQVYVGHNLMGAEFHWLPAKVLERFWRSLSSIDAAKKEEHYAYESINRAMESLHPESDEAWCVLRRNNGTALSRPFSKREYKSRYSRCSVPLARKIDQNALKALEGRLPKYNQQLKMPSWSPVYAALPVLRTTVVREPFSWLVSKYFWHGVNTTHCGSQDTAWMEDYATTYLMFLCGEDCLVRQEILKEDLESLAFQAEGNLRHSFAVVGLTNETETFYDMVTTRVGYLNMSRNLHVKGGKHTTRNREDYAACQKLFAEEDFRKKIVSRHRAVALMTHLFEVAVEVNRFQLNELTRCTGGAF